MYEDIEIKKICDSEKESVIEIHIGFKDKDDTVIFLLNKNEKISYLHLKSTLVRSIYLLNKIKTDNH